jgi:hypothetical protein
MHKWPAVPALTAVLLSMLVRGDAAPTEQNNKVTPGEFVVDHPTLINLGFEWFIEGDDNRNAQVEVSYRKQGETQWRQALPLLRLQGERIYQDQGVFNVVSPNMFAGSILDLEPDTTYEARFVMSDPDGFVGQTTKTITKTAKCAHDANQNPIPRGACSTYTRRITKGRRSSRHSMGLCAPTITTAAVEIR